VLFFVSNEGLAIFRTTCFILLVLDEHFVFFSDDGTFYFDEKFGGGREHQGSLSTTSSVVRGVTSFAAVTSGKIDVCEVS
jgi:hypothetical protein